MHTHTHTRYPYCHLAGAQHDQYFGGICACFTYILFLLTFQKTKKQFFLLENTRFGSSATRACRVACIWVLQPAPALPAPSCYTRSPGDSPCARRARGREEQGGARPVSRAWRRRGLSLRTPALHPLCPSSPHLQPCGDEPSFAGCVSIKRNNPRKKFNIGQVQ